MNTSRHKHGHGKPGAQSPTYKSWAGMKDRCRSTRPLTYSSYGGRGIGFDPRWEVFEHFLMDMGERPTGTTLDRINNDRGYSKENCRWATKKVQARNRRSTKLSEETADLVRRLYSGGGLAQHEIAKMFGLHQSMVSRIVNNKNWNPMKIKELTEVAYADAASRGWHDNPRTDLEYMALIHSEVSEAVEEIRKGTAPTTTYYSGADDKPEGVPSEMADVVIRIADYCGAKGIDLAQAIEKKLAYNRTRSYRHGKVL